MGRRGLILALFGLAWLIQGLAHFLVDPMSSGGFPLDHMPSWVVGGMWFTTGAISVTAAVVHRGRSDAFGFVAVCVMPMVNAVSYLVGAVTFAIANDKLWILGFLGFSVWGVVTLALGVIASWPEAPEMPDLSAIAEGSDDE